MQHANSSYVNFKGERFNVWSSGNLLELLYCLGAESQKPFPITFLTHEKEAEKSAEEIEIIVDSVTRKSEQYWITGHTSKKEEVTAVLLLTRGL